MIEQRERISLVKNVTDVTGGSNGVDGVIILSMYEQLYFVHWSRLTGIPEQQLSNLIRSNMDYENNVWKKGEIFNVNFQDIAYIVFNEPLGLTFRVRTGETRTFSFSTDPSDYPSLSLFISALILRGIAVPAIIMEENGARGLEIFPKCNASKFKSVSPIIQIRMSDFVSLDQLWADVQELFLKLISSLDEGDILPKDLTYPLASAARASHTTILNEIKEFIGEPPERSIVDSERWREFFDDEGRIIDFDLFKKTIYSDGLEEKLLPEALPLIFGVFGPEMTTEEKITKTKELEEQFRVICNQVDALQTVQIDANRKLNQSFRVISHDVERTDRSLPAFKNRNGKGLEILSKLLKCYCIFSPLIGYLQGMNDLFVPIILAFIPRWNEESQPLEEDGSVIEDAEKFMPMIFWCFDAMLKNVNQIQFLSNVTDQCHDQSEKINVIINEVSPIAGIWLRKYGLSQLLWCYSDFVLLFKRSFPNIWDVWFKLNCSPKPKLWLTYFSAAIFIEAFNDLSTLEDVAITTVMERYPRIMSEMDIWRIGQIALWLLERVKLEESKENYVPVMRIEDCKLLVLDS